MHLARPTRDLVEQYRSFWLARGLGYPDPLWPRHGFMVVEGGQLIAAAQLFLTEAKYALIEAFATNPAVTLRVRHAATGFLLQAILLVAAVLDTTVIMTPSDKSRGVIAIARRLGFEIGTHVPVFGGHL